MTSAEVSLRKKEKTKKIRETRHEAIESNGNFSVVLKDSFLTQTSTAVFQILPQHPDQPSVDPVMRQSQVENAAEEQNMLENVSDRSPTMKSAEVSLRKKDKRKKRRETRHNAIESNGNHSVVPYDAFSTETSTSALAMPPQHLAQPSVDPLMRQSLVEKAAKEKNMVENASDGSPTMTSAEVSLRKKDKRNKRRKTRHNDIESNGNLSVFPKDTFSTETSTAGLVMPPRHLAQPSGDTVMRQSLVENATKEKNLLENASDGSQTITSAEVTLRKKEKKKIRERGHDGMDSNGNISFVQNDTFLTQTSTAFIMPPQHPAQLPMDPTRQSQVENAAREKNMLENVSDGPPTMTNAEVSLGKKEKKKKRWNTRHNAIESDGNLSAVPKDTISTETSIDALVIPPQQLIHPSVDAVMKQSLVVNAAKEKNMLENASDESRIMRSSEVCLKMKEKRNKRRDTRHDGIESTGNLSAVPKDAFSTETSTAALAMPPTTHLAEHFVDLVMGHSQVENVSKEKSVLKNAANGSPAMTNAEVSLRKKDKRKKGKRKPNDVEINGNLSDVPRDTFSIETSTPAMVIPPAHPAQHSVDPVMKQSQVENAAKEKNVIENTLDGSPIMTGADVSLRKKDKRKMLKERRLVRLVAKESNGNLSSVPTDIISTETSTAAGIAMPPQYPAQYSVDPVTKQSMVENAGRKNHVLQDATDGYLAMTNADVNSRKKNKKTKRKRKKARHNDIEINVDTSGVPEDNFSLETSIPTLDLPSQHSGQYSMDPVMRQSQEENEEEVQNMMEKAADGSPSMTTEGVNPRKKNKKRKRRKARYKCDINLCDLPRDTFSPETHMPDLDMPSQYPAPCTMDLIMNQCQEEKEQNMVEKTTDGSPAVTSAEVNSGKKKKGRNRKKTRHDSLQSNTNISGVSKDTISTESSPPSLFMLSPQPSQSSMSQPPEENAGKECYMLDKGSLISNGEHTLEIKNSNTGPVVANSKHFEKEIVKLDTAQVDSDDLSLVTQQDDHSKFSHFSLGRTISNRSKQKLLVLDLNGLLADFVLGVPEGYKPDRKIHNKAVFKRPFCDDFLQFCFDKFHVGIWSSRKRQNVDAAIKLLVGNSASKLLFTWNQSHCTMTKFRTMEDKNKPLMLKELRKLWEKCRPDLPWKEGEFNESNTLLLDDSPYKALRNPMHTAIFPYSYRYSNTNDISLGPGGDLRVYLEGLATAENVQEYVASHPFGQPAITESNPHWDFYRLVRDQDLVANR